MKYLLKQGILIPFLFFIPVTIAGLMVPDYNWIRQQASEITLSHSKYAILILDSGALLSGLSCILLGLGIIWNFRKFYLTSFILITFGISMLTNGIFPMGSKMHGFYGIGLCIMLLTFAACYELKNEILKNLFFKISIISGIFIFIYFWAMLVGLDPAKYSGLTQRIASIIMFGWISYFSYELTKIVQKK